MHYHFEDIAATLRVHQHLIPGHGAIDFAATLEAIKQTDYEGWLTVELYPDIMAGCTNAAREAREFLTEMLHSLGMAESTRMARCQIDWPAWWQILRAANVFTAISNVIAGFLLVQGDWQPIGPLLLLMLASALLYEAGMVLNDVCDAELDAVERPERPIPSGRISRHAALRVGIGLLVGGVFIAVAVSAFSKQWQTVLFAVAGDHDCGVQHGREIDTIGGPGLGRLSHDERAAVKASRER